MIFKNLEVEVGDLITLTIPIKVTTTIIDGKEKEIRIINRARHLFARRNDFFKEDKVSAIELLLPAEEAIAHETGGRFKRGEWVKTNVQDRYTGIPYTIKAQVIAAFGCLLVVKDTFGKLIIKGIDGYFR